MLWEDTILWSPVCWYDKMVCKYKREISQEGVLWESDGRTTSLVWKDDESDGSVWPAALFSPTLALSPRSMPGWCQDRKIFRIIARLLDKENPPNHDIPIMGSFSVLRNYVSTFFPAISWQWTMNTFGGFIATAAMIFLGTSNNPLCLCSADNTYLTVQTANPPRCLCLQILLIWF